MRYLYGLTIQKIQSFIFETGKLKEIIGASYLVEDICTDRFKQFVGQAYNSENSIVTAAGKVVYIFDDRIDCERVVLSYLHSVLCEIPGLGVVQAVVEFEGDLLQENISLLERRLEIQKSKPTVSHGAGLMISERSRRTGGAGIVKEKGSENRLDRKQSAKLRAEMENKGGLLRHLFDDGEKFNAHDNSNIANLLSGRDKSWIAVVHADGNNLGRIIQSLSGSVNNNKLTEVLRTFSCELDKATKAAAKRAFQEVIRPLSGNEEKKQHIPIRPIILGGDDLTIIVRGDLALGFTEAYLRYFELFTQNLLAEVDLPNESKSTLKNGLTSCAGIAYIKESYPLHYGIDLAESLCKHAKKIAKSEDNPRSCLSFHRVMSSFSEDFNTIVERELTIAEDFTLAFGPYFLEKQTSGHESIKQLMRWAQTVNKQDAPKAQIRNWLTELKENEGNAIQLMNRIIALNGRYEKSLGLNPAPSRRGSQMFTHLYDVLTISNI